MGFRKFKLDIAYRIKADMKQLLAMIQEKDSVAVKLLIAQNISINELQNDIISFFGDVSGDADVTLKKPKASVSAIGRFGRDIFNDI